ncbi:MAG: DUF4401 domain-containing protein, partial [Chitinophagaceae bacterium]
LISDAKQTLGDSFSVDEETLLKEFHADESAGSSLAIKVLSILGGFLAAQAFMGFLFSAGLYKSSVGLIIAGSFFLAGSIWLSKKSKALIFDTFCVSAYLSGYFTLGMGFNEANMNDQIIALLFIIIALITLYIIEHFIFNLIAILVISGSCLFLIADGIFKDMIHSYIIITSISMTWWLKNEAAITTSHQKWGRMYNAIRTGLLLSLLLGLGFICKRGLFDFSLKYIWISSLALIPMLLLVINEMRITLGMKTETDKKRFYGLSLTLFLPLIFSPAITGALLILLSSFYVNYKTGFFLGILSLLYFTVQFYYDLDYSLLVKSCILILTGVLYLILFLLTQKKLVPDEKG